MNGLKTLSLVGFCGTLLLGASPADAQSSNSRAARLTYSGQCGWAGSGRGVYVENVQRSAVVTVTVRQSYGGFRPWSRSLVHQLQAGEERFIGCSRDDSIEGGYFQFSIVGERVQGGGGSSSRYQPPIPQPPTVPVRKPRSVTRYR